MMSMKDIVVSDQEALEAVMTIAQYFSQHIRECNEKCENCVLLNVNRALFNRTCKILARRYANLDHGQWKPA